jgi:acetylglutamate kinase
VKENMFYGASNLIFQRATELRATMTPAEEVLWNAIHINEWKLKFRRQHPIANYVVDFYCHANKLVIEVDGSIHNVEEVKKNDAYREEHLRDLGLTVLRFNNEDVLKNRQSVLNSIYNKINELQNTPLGDGGKDKLFVIKVGGNIIDDQTKLASFLKGFSTIFGADSKLPFRGRGLLVHGGGKIATEIGNKLGIESKYINGRRITDDATIDLVTMVYGGLINKKIVAQLQSLNCNAIGLTGADGNIIPATKRVVKDVDYGWVGDIENAKLKAENIKLLLDANFIPVFAPLTHDGQGHILNTNADTIASSLAVALSTIYDVRLIYCFEKKGVLENAEDENSVINFINKEKYKLLLDEQKLFAGILPKIDNAFAAIDAGVHEILIGDANDLIQNTTNETTGTLITQ